MKLLLTLSLLLAAGCASKGAIGVAYNRQGVVKVVFTGSPAEKADIRVEDIILNPKELRGPIGSICHVKGSRAGVEYEKAVKRADVNSFQRW